jgi:RNA polymerase sigma factor (sigma-70 family)
MPKQSLTKLAQSIRRLARFVDHEQPDGVLLQRFVEQRDQEAFADLVRRHGPLVANVCRQVLGNDQDAEDAFQATFLVLARKANTIRKPGSTGSWLHGVALRVAKKHRAALARRPNGTLHSPAMLQTDPGDDMTWKELKGVVHEELDRLPARCKAPILLCYFEGLTQDEAALRLGCKPRTCKARLARGRDLLRRRLLKRGVTLPAALTVPLLLPRAGEASISSSLIQATARAASSFAISGGVPGQISSTAIVMAKGALQSMVVTRYLLLGCTILLAFAITGATAGVLSRVQSANSTNRDSTDNQGTPSQTVKAGESQLPAGATMRLGSLRFRSERLGFASQFAFLPDNRTVIRITGLPSIRFWDIASGKIQRDIRLEPGSYDDAGFAISPDGAMLAVALMLPQQGNLPVEGKVQTIDVASGKPKREFKRTGRNPGSAKLVFTPDNKNLISLDLNGMLRIEELETGTEILNHAFPRDVANSLALSPDGSLIAMASGPNSRKVFLWKWQSGEDPKEIRISDRTQRLVFSPDGKLLAACSDIGGPVAIWDVAKAATKLWLTTGENYAEKGTPCFSPDGKFILAPIQKRGRSGPSREGIQVWSLETGKPERVLPIPGEAANSLCFSRNGAWLGAATDSRLHVWNWASGLEVGADDSGHNSPISQIAVGNSNIATVGDDHTVRIWEPLTGKEVHKWDHGAWVRAVALSADGSLAASSSLDDTVHVWNVREGKEIYRLPGHGATGGRRSLEFTPNGRYLVSYGDDYYLRRWDMRTGKAVVELDLRPPELKSQQSEMNRELMMIRGFSPLTVSPDGSKFLSADGNSITIYDAISGQKQQALEGIDSGLMGSSVFSPDSEYLAISSRAKSVQTKLTDGTSRFSVPAQDLGVWRVSTGKLVRQFQFAGASASPVGFTADGKCLVAITNKPSRRITFLNMADGKEVRSIAGLPESISAIGFSPNGKWMVVGLRDTTALVWSLQP